MEKEFKGKIVLVTGGTGTIGGELVRQILTYKPKQLRVFSRDESRQYHLQESLGKSDNLRFLIGDIRDRDRLDLALKGVDIVLHAAAMKHVSHCEYNPYEAVKTNIIGSQNVIDFAIKHKVKKVIGISTDKAANPTNVLGTSKLMMEKLFTNANYAYGKIETVFSCVRFGNIAWSNGSVLPLWKEQAKKDRAIQVTEKDMTRFIISKEQAIGLVLRAVHLAQGGEIFVLKMPAIKLIDLAELFIKKYYPETKIAIRVTGNRGREKKHEDLFDIQDMYKKVFSDKDMFIIVPDINLPKPLKEIKVYKNFKEIKTVENYSSIDMLNEKAVEKII